MSTDPSDGLRALRLYVDHLQQQRVSRRALLRASVIAAAGGAAALPARSLAGPAQAPGSNLALAQGLAPDTALVTSLRLPLPGIAANQAAPLLQGDVTNWHQVGAAVSQPVTVLAIDGLIPEGITPAETVENYDELAARLDQLPGGLAMLPTDMIDARVNTLEFDGISPLYATATESEPVVKIGIAGDIIFGRHGGNYQRRYGDYRFPMYQVKDFLSTFDVTVANFECFVSETIRPPELDDPHTLDFVTVPDSLQGMVMAGIDSVTMANNHAVYSDAGYGIPGMNDTIRHLTEAGIPPWGVGQDLDEARAPWVTEVNGLSIAFYGVDGVTANTDYPDSAGVVGGVNVGATASGGGTNPLVMANITADIEALAGQHDIVIPYFHMGDQYVWTPRQWVVDVSRRCIDAGASVVVSSHPHATMGMEMYEGKPIFYSIGNFVYDQMFSVETREGLFLDLTFRGRECIGFRTHGVEIMDFVQPRFMSPREQAGFLDRFWRSVDLLRLQQR